MENKPQLTVQIYLVGHGYELDFYHPGELQPFAHICRDFGGTYQVKNIQNCAVAVVIQSFECLEDILRSKTRKEVKDVKTESGAS